MAQLVKIFDCISRYEWNPYRYPSQFIRLKQENWRKLYALWQDQPEEFEEENEEAGTIQRLFQWSGFFKKEEDVPEEVDAIHPLSEMELKKHFLQKLLPIQMKWATSTVSDVSFIDEHVQDDERLTYFLQRFPDIYLVMFFPLFQIKDATFDAEIILIGPLGIEIIYMLDEEAGATIYADEERTWTVEKNYTKKKMLSPLLTLKRNEHIIKGMLQARGIEIPIHKTVLARNHMIVSNHEPYQTRIVGMHEYEKWFQEKRNIQAPLKHLQLQALETLLMYCVTTSVRRPEWKKDEDVSFKDMHED
ncbi:MAG TPA: nuclease-related domain-containing protein [Bacillota bacterium]|nr:nuclease-related domain-containing protein [Bacillota bacterium]